MPNLKLTNSDDNGGLDLGPQKAKIPAYARAAKMYLMWQIGASHLSGRREKAACVCGVLQRRQAAPRGSGCEHSSSTQIFTFLTLSFLLKREQPLLVGMSGQFLQGIRILNI